MNHARPSAALLWILKFGVSLVFGVWCLVFPRPASAQTNVQFPDPTLEAAVRSALNLTNGPVTPAAMANLRTLGCWSAVTNLSGLEFATNLATLRLLRGNPVSFSPLAGLGQLTNLALEFASPQNCPGVSNLFSLTQLDLYQCGLSNVSFVVGLTNLAVLDLSWNQVTAPGVLGGLPRLQALDLSGNPLANSPGLALLTNISGSLYLDYVPLTNADYLGALRNLTELTIYQDHVEDLAPLSNLGKLKALDVAYNPVQDYAALNELTNLQSLCLEGNALSNLNRLPMPPALRSLDANFNRLRDITALAGLTNLQWLNLSYNGLTNIDALTNLGQLATAYLQVNLLDTNSSSSAMAVVHALANHKASVFVDPQHSPPVISVPDHWYVPANEVASQPFYVSDDSTMPDQMLSGVQSSNLNLLAVSIGQSPEATYPSSLGLISFAWLVGVPNGPSVPGWSGYLNLTPAPNQTGTTTVTLTVMDDFGLAASIPVTVTVAVPQPFDGQLLTGSESNVIWSTFGAVPWVLETNVSLNGSALAQSGSADSWLEAAVTGPGLLSFWWKIDTTNNTASYGSLGGKLIAECAASGLSGTAWTAGPTFGTNGEIIRNTNWQFEVLSVPAGDWTFRWQALSAGQALPILSIADVAFTPGEAPCSLDIAPPQPAGGAYLGGSFLTLHGPPGELFDVLTSADLRQWTRLARMVQSDFQVLFLDTNAPAAAQFYRLSHATPAPMWFEAPALDANRNIQLLLHSEPKQPFQLQSSTNLLDWETLVETNNWNGVLPLAGGAVADSNVRFYRAKALPWNLRPGSPVQPAEPPRRHLFSFPLMPPYPSTMVSHVPGVTVFGTSRRLADSF